MSDAESARIRQAARDLVADWPPLTEEQRSRLASIFASARQLTARSRKRRPAARPSPGQGRGMTGRHSPTIPASVSRRHSSGPGVFGEPTQSSYGLIAGAGAGAGPLNALVAQAARASLSAWIVGTPGVTGNGEGIAAMHDCAASARRRVSAPIAFVSRTTVSYWSAHHPQPSAARTALKPSSGVVAPEDCMTVMHSPAERLATGADEHPVRVTPQSASENDGNDQGSGHGTTLRRNLTTPSRFPSEDYPIIT